MRRIVVSPPVKPPWGPCSLFLGLLAAWCITVCFVQGGIAAQDETFTGTWYHEGDDAERAQRDGAIDRATKDMGALMRGRARNMLREKTTPQREISLADEGDRVTVSRGDRRVTITTDGSPTRVTGEGGAGTIQSLRQKGQLVVIFRGDTGIQTTVYHLSDDQKRLTLDISITGGQLPKPLRYRVTYISRSEYDRKRSSQR